MEEKKRLCRQAAWGEGKSVGHGNFAVPSIVFDKVLGIKSQLKKLSHFPQVTMTSVGWVG